MLRPATIVAAVVLAALLYVGARPVGPAPALGPLLDPANGAWALARSAELPREARAAVPGLGAGVDVRYDDRGVPHVFAQTMDDAWRALGYVVARDRLAQLEIQTLAGSGRLTEIAGARALPLDREMRTLGLPSRAKERYALLADTSLAKRALDAFADGVNAHIAAMGDADLPMEHRLLGRRPARWEPWHGFVLMGRMAYTLAYNEGELQRERAAAMVGEAAADALFPRDMPLQEPIQPNGLGRPREAWRPLPPPGTPDTAALLASSRIAQAVAARDEAGGALGSNNWAVAPARSASGRALLAGDPHLELTLPSIWYEAHLVVRDSLDVYGVTIPGAPAIIIGFNRDAAWTYTNVEGDFVDRWVETVDDTAAPTRYQVDGAWRPLRTRIETYRDRDGAVVATDTIRLTHRGPMERVDGRWISMRWTALEATQDVDAFLQVMGARDVADYRARTAGYQVPPQNMLVADRRGGIGIRSTGWFPLRGGDGTGMTVQDGRLAAADWTGALPIERYPEAVNPAQGFLASANQQPRDPQADRTYLGADWYAPWRAMRINALLRADSSVTPDDMRRFQTDPGSARADRWVPVLLDAARRELAAGRGTAALRDAERLLGEWDRRYTKDNRRAVLFELAMTELNRRTWDELTPRDTTRRPRFPNDAILLGLTLDSTSVWWDDRRTDGVRETRDGVLAASLAAALDVARARHGDPAGDDWRWDGIRQANIHHLLRIPALSALKIPVQAGPSTLSPSSGNGAFGASWRMVVELAETPRAWTVYPGGQSGNPASRFYRDRVAMWSNGELAPALVPRRAADLPRDRVAATLALAPAAPEAR